MNSIPRKCILGMFIFLIASIGAAANELDVVKTPVPFVLDSRFTVQNAQGKGEIPIRTSRDWTISQPDVSRAIIIIHGWPRRDLDADASIAKQAGSDAQNTIFITPQFLTEADVVKHQLATATLRWDLQGWRNGYDAQAPAPISSFSAMDAILQRLADQSKFPHLQTIVIAGHSAGGQFVQRYAAVGRGESELAAQKIHVRYVVANPATYLYFSDKRMQADGEFLAVDPKSCPAFNAWNMGLTDKTPSYLAQPISTAALEKSYLARDVIYLLGTADNDPNADALGSSCRYKIQGENRYARGQAYAKYINLISQGHSNHHLIEVANVAHRPYAMYASTCGLAALFDTPGCDNQH